MDDELVVMDDEQVVVEGEALGEKSAAGAVEAEPLDEQAARYKGALEKYLAVEKQAVPEHVLVLLEKLDPVEQMEYLAAHRGALALPLKAGVPASPEPRERTLSQEENERARRGQAAIYSNF